MSLGTNISRLRAEKRLSQGDLAEVLEVSRQSVSKWETDSSVPDLDKLIKLSQLFRVTLDELVTGAEPQLKVETPPVMVSPSMPGRKIAGIILFCMAFLAFLIPTVLGGILVGLILAVPFLVCGIICFLVRKRPGLWCAWAAYLAVYIFCYYGTRISWNLFFFTFSLISVLLCTVNIGTPVYTFAAWIQSLMILALLIGTVRSFCTFSFPPTRRNGVILVVLWIEFLAYRLLTAPIADLLSAPEIPVTSMWALMALILMAGIASLILLAIVLTLSVRMAAAWRASHC